MAKDKMTLDDIELVKRIVRKEFAELAEAVDEASVHNLTKVCKNVDACVRNIMKLQAQATALKEMLISKGIVSRERLYSMEMQALTKLESQARGEGEAVPS